MPPKTENHFDYLPISRRNVQWDLYVTGVGEANVAPGEPYPPPGHPGVYDFDCRKGRVLAEYQVVYLTAGGGVFESAAVGEVEVHAGDVMLLFPGVWHRYQPGKKGWSEHWVGLNGEYLYRLAKRKVISPECPILKTDGDPRLLEFYRQIAGNIHSSRAENPSLIAAFAMAILALAVERAGRSAALPRAARNAAVDDPLVAKAVGMIWTHSHRNTVVDDLVAALPVTRRTLERKFEAVLGRSIGQEIARCRIERARHLLEETRLPLEHVALAVGFSGADRMGKVFRRIEGMTPGSYRRQKRRKK